MTPSHASTTSNQPSTYETYSSPNGVTKRRVHTNNQQQKGYLTTPKLNDPPRSPQVFPNPAQYDYNANFEGSPPTYPSALPATAAAANAYMSAYPNQAAPGFPHNNTYTNPGSPTSWRTWAGNITSNLEPGPEYMNSASALIQLGGRGEESAGQNLHSAVDMQQGNALNGATAQMWPFNIFNSGPAA